METLALLALAALALGSRKSAESATPSTESKPAPPQTGFGEAVKNIIEEFGPPAGAVVGLGGTSPVLTGLAGPSAGAKAVTTGGAKSALLGWTLPTSVAGVATGFLVVAGLWAVALVAGLVVSGLQAPEVARRDTMKLLYGAPQGSYLWRAGRMFWARLAAERLRALSVDVAVVSLSWPWLATPWGEVQVRGELPVLVRPGETLPKGATDVYPEDVYEVARWPSSRPAPESAVADVVVQAHLIARLWVDGYVAAVAACGRAIGEVSGRPSPCGLLIELGTDTPSAGLLSSFGAEQGAAVTVQPDVPAQRAAFLQGMEDGLRWVRSYAYGFGGRHAMQDSNAVDVAASIGSWAPAGLGFGSSGSNITVDGVSVATVKVSP